MEQSVIKINLYSPVTKRIVIMSLNKDVRLGELTCRGFDNVSFFFTWDKEGTKAVGKLSQTVGSVLKDNDLIYLSYNRIGNMMWTRTKHQKYEPCDLCGNTSRSSVTNRVVYIMTFPAPINYCYSCFEKVKTFRNFTCVYCGKENVGIVENKKEERPSELHYVARCEKECEVSDIRSRECNLCGLPLMKSKKCSKCQQTYYCSKECQTKDWPSHKTNCGTKPQ